MTPSWVLRCRGAGATGWHRVPLRPEPVSHLPNVLRNDASLPDWLPSDGREWVATHSAVLDAIVEHLERTTRWPDPVALERQLRAHDVKLGLVAAIGSLPRYLGWRTHEPPEVVLTPFGLACATRGAWILNCYVAALHFALARYDSPSEPDVIARSELQEQLELNDHRMDVVSRVLLGAGNPFFAGGNTNLEAWELRIDERVVAYEHVRTVADLMDALACERLPSAAPPTSPSGGPQTAGSFSSPPNAPTPEESNATALAALAVVLGLGADVLSIAVAPVPLAAAVVAASLAALGLRRYLFRTHPSVLAFATTLSVAAISAFGAWLLTRGTERAEPRTRDLGEQIDTVLSQAARGGRHAVFQRQVRFHGATQSQSWLVVLRDDLLRNHPAGDVVTDSNGKFVVPRSDELRVYDMRAGVLRLAYRSMPQEAGRIQQLPEGDAPSFRFRARAVSDIDANGRIELVGAFERVTLASGPLPVPVILSWDDAGQRYRLRPLIPQPPELARPSGIDASLLTAYTRATTIRDQFSGETLKGYAVDEYSVESRSAEAVVVAGYIDQSTMGTGRRFRYQVLSWLIDQQTGEIEALPCISGIESAVFAYPGDAPDPTSAILRTARRHSPSHCE